MLYIYFDHLTYEPIHRAQYCCEWLQQPTVNTGKTNTSEIKKTKTLKEFLEESLNKA